jgi:DNA-binding IscR family transcriptional regulator
VYPFGDGKRKTRPMKLELSSEGRYALRALVYLARDAGSGELVTADRISTEAVVPRSLLARVMAKLARAGLVETSEGRVPPRPTARRRQPPRCRGGRGGTVRDHALHHAAASLRRGRPCALHDAWVEGQNAILEHLGKQTLADFSSQAPPFPR